MSPSAAVLVKMRFTACSSMEKRDWLEARGANKCLADIPGSEILRVASVLFRYLTALLNMVLVTRVEQKTKEN